VQAALRDAERAVNIAMLERPSIGVESADLTAAKHAQAMAQAQHEGALQAVSAAQAAVTLADNTLSSLRGAWLDTALRLEDQRHELLLLGPPTVWRGDPDGH